MSDKRQIEELIHPALASRITGIVFWGLVIVGLSLTYILIKDTESEVEQRYDSLADHLSFELVNDFASVDEIDDAALNEKLTHLAHHGDASLLAGLSLLIDERRVVAGDISEGIAPQRRQLMMQSGKADERLAVQVDFYFQPLQQVVNHERKQLLLTFGGMFMLFGFVLQWVLRRVLTDPFLRMVETSMAISNGEDEQRFNEGRDDEFGFLAKFINRSLDHLVQQKNELGSALQRVRESEAELYKEKVRAEITFHSIGGAVVTTDESGRIEYLNPLAERLCGWGMADVVGMPIEGVINLIDEDQGMALPNPVLECMHEGERFSTLDGNCSLVAKDGRVIPVSASASPIRDHNDVAVGAIMIIQDVTPTRRLARELAYQASHDALTGLFNRVEFEDHLENALESAQRGECEHALCYIDLDQFKVVNDTCGHMAGDELLRQLSHRLSGMIRGQDTIARLGGDELGVLLMGVAPDQAEELAEQLLNSVNEFRFGWDDYVFDIGASIGMVLLTRDSLSVAEVMSNADVACYAAKDLGRNRIHIYQPDDHDMARRRGEMQWVTSIQKAMEEQRLCLFFQPIVPIVPHGDAKPHYEVLVRLRDREGDLVPPMAFIPAAERYNLMPAIDRWVIQAALEYMRDERLNCGDYTCAINLSGATLSDSGVLEFVTEAIESSGIAPTRLMFEITETAAISHLAAAEKFMATLHKMGCHFALDDFGSGLSSFGYLKSLKVDYLKIDGSFVRDMVNDPVDFAMVEAIHHVGYSMGIKTIAEFVENEEVLKALCGIGVDFAQGFHIARPSPLAEFTDPLREACMEADAKALHGMNGGK